MPRGVKGSGKPAASKKSPKVAVKTASTDKTRKAYPSREERVAMADKQIARLTKLNESRRALIAKTEKVLAERQAALVKSDAALKKELAKKARLTATPEVAREARKNKRAKLSELASALEASGKSVEEVLALIGEKQ